MNANPDLLTKLQEAREIWSRHDYQICARAMIEIDIALDELNEYTESVRKLEEVFNG